MEMYIYQNFGVGVKAFIEFRFLVKYCLVK